jgi:hypothetical protein
MSYGYLWMHLGLDILVIQCYAPGCSRFNPVERTWSFLTKCLVGVRLDDEIDGNVPSETESKLWDQILDRAVDDCGRFWDGKKFAGFPIAVSPLYSTDPLIPHLKDVHTKLYEFVNAPKKSLKDQETMFPKLQKDYQFFVKHVTRKAFQLEFVRCVDGSCSHCSKLPARQNTLLDVVRKFGGSFPTPEMGITKKHYKSLEEMIRFNNAQLNPFTPTYDNCTIHGCCPHKTCRYAFFTKTDIKRHNKLMSHPKPKPKKRSKKQKNVNRKRAKKSS